MNEKILITGAGGFIGFYITKELSRRGYPITAFCRVDSPGGVLLQRILPEVQIRSGDLYDFQSLEAAMEGIDIVVHAAGKVSFSSADSYQVHKINVESTAQLVNLCLEKKIQQLIHISSVSALGGLPDQQHFDETANWDIKGDHNLYAISKHLAELEVWRGAAEGLNVCLLCPSVVMGVWMKEHHNMQIFNTVKKQIPFYPPGSTGWVDVRDVAIAVLQSIQRKIQHERIILNGHNVSYKAIMDASAEILKIKKPKYRLYYPITYVGAKCLSLINRWFGKKPIIPSAVVKSMFNHSSYDAAKSRQMLGIEYKSIPESLKWVLEEKLQ